MGTRPKGGDCTHTSRQMIAYGSTAQAAHAAAFWCPRCGALGWHSYELGGQELWQLPELRAKRPRAKRRR